MKATQGIVAVVFCERDGKKEFLILHRILNWSGWEMLKGSIDEKERIESALRREIFEETGIRKIISIKKLPVCMRFFDQIRNCKREMQGFLVQVDGKEKVSLENNEVAEHDAFEWADAKAALKKLTHKEQKNVLKAALKALA